MSDFNFYSVGTLGYILSSLYILLNYKATGALYSTMNQNICTAENVKKHLQFLPRQKKYIIPSYKSGLSK